MTDKILLSILIWFGCLSQVQAMSAIGWVEKMSESMRNLNYHGTFVYMHGEQLESMSISHLKDEDGEKERLLSLNGEAREVIRDNDKFICIWPSSKTVVIDSSKVDHRSPLFIPDDIASIRQFYDLKLIGTERIANKKAVIIDITSKDQLRYGLKLWIAEDSGLLVKSNLFDEDGQLAEQVMFTDLEVLPENHGVKIETMPKLTEGFAMVRFHQSAPSEAASSDMPWQLKDMRNGFRQESVLTRKASETGLFTHQMLLTDGLATVSVFIEKNAMQYHRMNTSMGAVNAFIRVVDGYSITAIGEVPAITVQQVAQAISYKKPHLSPVSAVITDSHVN